jgi:hypothetical protein
MQALKHNKQKQNKKLVDLDASQESEEEKITPFPKNLQKENPTRKQKK